MVFQKLIRGCAGNGKKKSQTWHVSTLPSVNSINRVLPGLHGFWSARSVEAVGNLAGGKISHLVAPLQTISLENWNPMVTFFD